MARCNAMGLLQSPRHQPNNTLQRWLLGVEFNAVLKYGFSIFGAIKPQNVRVIFVLTWSHLQDVVGNSLVVECYVCVLYQILRLCVGEVRIGTIKDSVHGAVYTVPDVWHSWCVVDSLHHSTGSCIRTYVPYLAGWFAGSRVSRFQRLLTRTWFATTLEAELAFESSCRRWQAGWRCGQTPPQFPRSWG